MLLQFEFGVNANGEQRHASGSLVALTGYLESLESERGHGRS
jgi:hypothetical protein